MAAAQGCGAWLGLKACSDGSGGGGDTVTATMAAALGCTIAIAASMQQGGWRSVWPVAKVLGLTGVRAGTIAIRSRRMLLTQMLCNGHACIVRPWQGWLPFNRYDHG